MDEARAKRMAAELVGKTVGKWTLLDYLGAGKSALVFRASNGATEAALKIFDPELVDRYGRDVQAARIERERRLIGKSHQYLISIYDGGYDDSLGYFFIVMALFRGKTLELLLGSLSIQQAVAIIGQVSSAAKFLESEGLVHRDIKPDNIGLDATTGDAVLLDLGVIRPISAENITDDESARPFVGTLRYAPIEFLRREEQDDVDGWRAVTFYQIGAVLYDLLAGKRIYDGVEYPRIIEAIGNEEPDYSLLPSSQPELVLLVRKCLVKRPEERLRLVSWSDLENPPIGDGANVDRIKQRIIERQAVRRAALRGDVGSAEADSPRRRAEEIVNVIREQLREEAISSGLFPPFEINHRIREDGQAIITVLFSESVTFDLRNPATLGFELGGTNQTLVCIRSQGMLGRESKEVELAITSNLDAYNGPGEAAYMRPWLSKQLYEFFDWAQSRGETANLSGQFWKPDATEGA
jgi:serine/threonine protein kinase